jgi:regulator of sigma E protease
MIDWFADLMPLAAAVSDDAGFLSTLLFRIVLWVQIALGIGLVIFVHELGHFVAAKTFGVKCEKFYVGFDVPLRLGPIKFPRTLGKFRYGETEYGIGVIPLGGYVKMLGQDDDPRKQEAEAKRIRMGEEAEDAETPQLDPRSFPAKPVWQRMIIISAGVVMNVITGVLFAAIAYGYGISYIPAVVGGVTPGGPAWQAGIEPGGRVVAVGGWSDPQMHFREMRMEILTKGLEYPDEPINLAVQYDDGVRDYELRTQADPQRQDARMVGLAMPNSSKIAGETYAVPESVAAEMLSSEDADAEVLAFNGTPINEDSINPVTPMMDYLYRHPDKPVELRLRRSDGTERTVTLPPQPAKSLGVRYAVGPIAALVAKGPAATAGLKVGDRIVQFNDDTSPDAYGMAEQLVGVKEPVTLVVERGEGESSETLEITIEPVESLQSIAPTSSIAGEIAINSVGFAYRPLPVVESIVRAKSDDAEESALTAYEDSIQPGDTIEWVELDKAISKGLIPEDDEHRAALLEQLVERWEISPIRPLNSLRDLIQILPAGTPLTVAVTRPARDGEKAKVIITTVRVAEDELKLFDRGLVLGQRQAVQRAGSVQEALSLGLREGYRRFTDVIRFLKMIPRGQIKLRHVGGPLEIVNIAKNEAEKGIAPQLMFLTMLSMNLAILNFLPIPALDGGHMMFLIYELVAGKRANEQLEFRLTVAGLLTLLMLMAVVFANDIIRHL